jgi:hypothetical protein
VKWATQQQAGVVLRLFVRSAGGGSGQTRKQRGNITANCMRRASIEEEAQEERRVKRRARKGSGDGGRRGFAS